MHSLSVGLNDRRPTDLASCKVKENVSNELIISVHIGCEAIIFLGHFTILSLNFVHYISDNVLTFMLSTAYSTNYSQPVLLLFEKVVSS